jgi:hypothetical protein
MKFAAVVRKPVQQNSSKHGGNLDGQHISDTYMLRHGSACKTLVFITTCRRKRLFPDWHKEIC